MAFDYKTSRASYCVGMASRDTETNEVVEYGTMPRTFKTITEATRFAKQLVKNQEASTGKPVQVDELVVMRRQTDYFKIISS